MYDKTSNQSIENYYSSPAFSVSEVKLSQCIECLREGPIGNACDYCDEPGIIFVDKLDDEDIRQMNTDTSKKNSDPDMAREDKRVREEDTAYMKAQELYMSERKNEDSYRINKNI